MKKIAAIAPLLGLMLSAACSKDDGYDTYSYNEPTLYSSSGKAMFSEVILFLKPYVLDDDGTKMYVVVDSLRNISVAINDRMQRPCTSYGVDTAHVADKSVVGGYSVSSEPIAYPVQVKIMLYPDELQTAGQYADLLTDYFAMSPGAYIFRVLSFDVLSATGQPTTIYTPRLSLPLEVKENSVSVSMGEFEVEVPTT